MRSRRAYALIYLVAVLSLGHHIDHAIRGNHTGWPLTEHVTPFTYSLAVYPLILLGLYLSRTGKAGAGYWLALSGLGAVLLAAVHLGPTALEPPGDILNGYSTPLPGWLAFGWFLLFIAVLAVLFLHEAHAWWQQRQRKPGTAI